MNSKSFPADWIVKDSGTWVGSTASEFDRASTTTVTRARRDNFSPNWRSHTSLRPWFGAGLFANKAWTGCRTANACARTKSMYIYRLLASFRFDHPKINFWIEIIRRSSRPIAFSLKRLTNKCNSSQKWFHTFMRWWIRRAKTGMLRHRHGLACSKHRTLVIRMHCLRLLEWARALCQMRVQWCQWHRARCQPVPHPPQLAKHRLPSRPTSNQRIKFIHTVANCPIYVQQRQ